MGFLFRKSINFGPLRFNLSRSGLGASIGFRGFRLGTGPRGHYIQVGAGGIGYRTALSDWDRSSSDEAQHPPSRSSLSSFDGFIRLKSVASRSMVHQNASALLEDLNRKYRRRRKAIVFPQIIAALVVVASLSNGAAALPYLVLGFPAWMIGSWIDRHWGRVAIQYDLDSGFWDRYQAMQAAFAKLRDCAVVWHISAGRNVEGMTMWKQQAGAARLLRRHHAKLGSGLPRIIRSAILPPAIRGGSGNLYFLPDMMLTEDGSGIGAVSYTDLCLRHQITRFIEDGAVPADADVVDETWAHPNMDGGPDRRFGHNPKLPVCSYETLLMTSGTGLNEMYQFSRTGVVAAWAAAIHALGNNRRGSDRAGIAPALPPGTPENGSTFDVLVRDAARRALETKA